MGEYYPEAHNNIFDNIDDEIDNIYIRDLHITNNFIFDNIPIHISHIGIQNIYFHHNNDITEVNNENFGKNINMFFPKLPFNCKIAYMSKNAVDALEYMLLDVNKYTSDEHFKEIKDKFNLTYYK